MAATTGTEHWPHNEEEVHHLLDDDGLEHEDEENLHDISDDQIQYYTKYFMHLQSDPESGISGKLARDFFVKSSLPQQDLASIW